MSLPQRQAYFFNPVFQIVQLAMLKYSHAAVAQTFTAEGMASLKSTPGTMASFKSCAAAVISQVVAIAASRFKTMKSVVRDVVAGIITGALAFFVCPTMSSTSNLCVL